MKKIGISFEIAPEQPPMVIVRYEKVNKFEARFQ